MIDRQIIILKLSVASRLFNQLPGVHISNFSGNYNCHINDNVVARSNAIVAQGQFVKIKGVGKETPFWIFIYVIYVISELNIIRFFNI